MVNESHYKVELDGFPISRKSQIGGSAPTANADRANRTVSFSITSNSTPVSWQPVTYSTVSVSDSFAYTDNPTDEVVRTKTYVYTLDDSTNSSVKKWT